MRVLVTGAAGFIGYHTVKRLLADGKIVIGADSINDYYDKELKYNRLSDIGIQKNNIIPNKEIASISNKNYCFYQVMLEDVGAIMSIFENENIDTVIHLAAQAGVRYSITNPSTYINSNIVAFANILECCKKFNCKHLVYASSSSVYGLNETIPFATAQNVDHPLSLYAASKKSNELMAHVYSHLFQLPTTGLRFFTVYGPWGRPDMALFLFTKAILENNPIQVFNNGNMQRDFTYIDDVVEGIIRVLQQPPKPNPHWISSESTPASSSAPYKVYNIGNNAPVQLLHFIEAIEEALHKKAIKHFLPMQPGDVPSTFADVSDLIKDVGYKPGTSVKEGIKKFIEWYKRYYNV